MNKVIGIFMGIGVSMLILGCQPDYPNCKKDEHCHDGEFCVNNLCQQCRGSEDCPQGQECTGGGCREIPSYCVSNADCAEGQVCRDSSCGPCLQNSDCGDSQVCAEGLCITAECQSDQECPAGLACVNYKCQIDETSTSQLGPGDCVLEPIYFEFDSSEVNDDMRTVLENNFVCLQKRGGKVTLEGHCDAAGTTEYNMALGERRAKVVYKLLERMGIDKGEMRVISKGEEESTGANVAKDRRVEFK
ncbi:MAG: OmpA family protein [Deltaproteobacteria bacterium]|nr:OmpA family protein [Deltaproteobacteria bacterium]MBN2674182.1 OmpA family protein [Deltaproteobacteria bacterium]